MEGFDISKMLNNLPYIWSNNCVRSSYAIKDDLVAIIYTCDKEVYEDSKRPAPDCPCDNKDYAKIIEYLHNPRPSLILSKIGEWNLNYTCLDNVNFAGRYYPQYMMYKKDFTPMFVFFGRGGTTDITIVGKVNNNISLDFVAEMFRTHLNYFGTISVINWLINNLWSVMYKTIFGLIAETISSPQEKYFIDIYKYKCSSSMGNINNYMTKEKNEEKNEEKSKENVLTKAGLPIILLLTLVGGVLWKKK